MTVRWTSVAVLTAIALLAAPAGPVRAEPVADATSAALRQFASGVRDAEGVLAAAAATLSKDLATGAKTPFEAASGYTAAFVFFATSVKTAADDAAAPVATAVSEVIVDRSDPSLPGVLAGDGGAFDRFVASMQKSMDAARGRALKNARKFAKSLTKSTARTQMNVMLPPWTFERRIAPSLPSPVAPATDHIRLLAAVATLLDDGRVVVGVSGRAPASASGNFDVRLLAVAGQLGVGPLLSAGGIPVNTAGTWTSVATLNDPTQGEAVTPGNRVVAFGIDPFDGGLAGRQPGRFLHGGVIGIP